MAGEIYLSNLSGSFDYQVILDKYQELQNIELNRLYLKEQDVLKKKSAYSSYYDLVKNLGSAFEDMTDPLLVDSKTASVADESVATVSILDATKLSPTSLDFSVTQTALQDVWLSLDGVADKNSGAVASTDGTLEIKYAGNVVATIDYDTDDTDATKPSTLQEIADAINSAQDKVQATIFYDGSKYRLLLKGADTGANNTIELNETGSGDLLDNLQLGTNYSDSNVQAAQDAIISVYGQDVTSSTNTFSNVIDRLEFTIAKDAAGKSTTITVANDTEKIVGAVQGFFDAFNSLVDFERQYTAADGDLSGDTTLFTVRSMIMRNFDPFYEQGLLSVDKDTGKVTLDRAKLEDMINTNPEDVKSFLQTVDDTLSPVVSAIVDPSGIVDSRIDSFDKKIDSIEKQIESTTRLFEAEIERLKKQFVELDALMAQMNDIQARLASFNPPSTTKQ